MDNYSKIVQTNIEKIYSNLSPELQNNIIAEKEADKFIFNAFGQRCIVSPSGIQFEDSEEQIIQQLLVSLYLLNANSQPCIIEPLKAFKDFPNSMPYVGAFSTHTENILNTHTLTIEKSKQKIIEKLNGKESAQNTPGDFSFIVYPLPKIALCYIFYHADEDFEASTKCLFSNNAVNFMPIDGLADVGEYTSKMILKLIK